MSSTSRGLELEERVFSFLEAEIKAHRFLARPECCAIFHRKAYYSRDRQSNIIFDVAIELTLPGESTPSMFWLIECKHYDHPVSVDDVEEFFTKVQQVAAAKSKAIVVSSHSFQSGAVEFACSKGIGLLRVFPKSEFKWVLHRSPSSLHMSRSLSRDGDVLRGLTQEHYHSRRFDFFCNVGDSRLADLFPEYRRDQVIATHHPGDVNRLRIEERTFHRGTFAPPGQTLACGSREGVPVQSS
jgi:hypothetical protein